MSQLRETKLAHSRLRTTCTGLEWDLAQLQSQNEELSIQVRNHDEMCACVCGLGVSVMCLCMRVGGVVSVYVMNICVVFHCNYAGTRV